MLVAIGAVGRGSARAAARDIIKGQGGVPSRGSGGASPYRAAGRDNEFVDDLVAATPH